MEGIFCGAFAPKCCWKIEGKNYRRVNKPWLYIITLIKLYWWQNRPLVQRGEHSVNNAHSASTATPEVESKVEPEVESEVEPEVESEVEPEVEPEIKSEIEPNVESEVQSQVEPEVESEVEPKVEPEVE